MNPLGNQQAYPSVGKGFGQLMAERESFREAAINWREKNLELQGRLDQAKEENRLLVGQTRVETVFSTRKLTEENSNLTADNAYQTQRGNDLQAHVDQIQTSNRKLVDENAALCARNEDQREAIAAAQYDLRHAKVDLVNRLAKVKQALIRSLQVKVKNLERLNKVSAGVMADSIVHTGCNETVTRLEAKLKAAQDSNSGKFWFEAHGRVIKVLKETKASLKIAESSGDGWHQQACEDALENRKLSARIVGYELAAQNDGLIISALNKQIAMES